MIGSHVYKGNMGDVKNIDTDSFNTGSDGAYGFTVNSTTIGTNSFTRGNLATTIGDYNIQSGRSVGYGLSSWVYGAQNFGATVIGALNSNESQSSYSGTSGVANSIVGVANRVNSSNGTLVFGAGNEVTHSLSDIYGVDDTTSLRDAKKAQDALKNAVAESDAGGAVLAIGGANKADWAQKSQLIGVGNTLTGASSAVSEYNMINGYKNEVTNATHTSIIGSNNKAKNIQSTTVMGDNNDLTGNGNHVIGDNHKVTGKNNILIGNNKEQKTHSGSDSVIIGNNASAGNGSMAMGNEAHAGNTGIALGMKASAGDGQNLAIGYYANVSGATNSTALGYASKVEKRDILSSDGKDGVVSVGKSVGQSGEAGITRRIINVKAGVNDTDAVNVSQLKKVSDTANAGWNLSTNGVATEATNVKPGEYVDFSGDKNISVSHDGTNVKVELNKNIDVNSVQTNALNSKYNLSVGTMAENGIMPFLVNSTGAFYAANNNFSVDKDGKVIATAGEIGNVVLKNGVYTGNSALRDGELYVGDADGNYSQITTKGAKLGKVTVAEDGKISGVAAGVADTDAVNVGQLKEAVQAGNTDTHIKPGEYGVGADNKVNMDVVDKNGNKVDTVTIKDVAKASDVGNVNNIASDIKNQDGSHTTVVDAVNNLNQKLDNKVGDLNYVEGGKGNYVTNGENTTTSIGKLDQALKDVAATAAKHTTVTQGDNITVTPGTNTDGSKNYNVALKKDITVESVTANTFKADQTVMNKDGLKVGNKVSVSATAVTAGKTSISDEGVKVGDKTYISDKGLNANEQKVTNVDAGELSATSKDAVNGSQLYETNQAIANNATNISSLSHSISNLDNRVNKVGAGAAALAALHPLDFDPDAKWDFAAGYGNYRGANAAAVGAYYRPNEDTMFSVGGTFGNGENMVNAGVSFKLGSGSSHVSTSRVAMAKEIKELRGELEAMKSAMLDANAGKKIDTSKLQLFPDVPQNHWAYEYVAQLAGNGMIEGYPDGNFAGDRPMTRYEFAAILYRAMTKGAVLSDKILSEFSHELEYFTVDTIAKDKAGNPTIQRVRTVKENKNK